MEDFPTDIRDELESYPNVVGTGVGPRRVGGRRTDEEAIVVFVSRKLPRAQLNDADCLPEAVTVDDREVRVDVQEIGEPRAQAAPALVDEEARWNRKRRWRPAPAGVSFGHPEITAGTLGTPPLRTAEGDLVVLTNAHVAAPIGAADEGDQVLQPGPADGGDLPEDDVGTLAEWSDIDRDEPNPTDSALVAIDGAVIRDDVLGLGPLRGWADAGFDATYAKSGRTTGVTTGDLRARNVRVQVGGYYPEPVTFVGVDVFSPMSAGGDSGSVIGVERDGGFYGTHLLFAGSDQTTLGIPLETVQEHHGELTPVSPAELSVPFDRRVERRLRAEFGERVAADGAGDEFDFRVDAWTASLRVVVVESVEDALASVGSALAAADDGELPVIVYPSDEETGEVRRIGAQATLVGLGT
jgi:hypothetical protein